MEQVNEAKTKEVLSHPAYTEEKDHLTQTLRDIDSEHAAAVRWAAERYKEVGDDDAANQLYQSALDRLDTLQRAKRSAYFGRIDIRSDKNAPTQSIYIGRHGVHRQDTNEIIIHNWQAPIGRVFYQRRAGRTTYDTPAGLTSCEVMLRRNLAIDTDRVLAIADDFDMRAGRQGPPQMADPYLVEVLNQQGTGYLQDIVATIQAEQDDVIRAVPERPLVVQGVAGSGKTSVVFARVAYLLYTLRDRLRAEDVLVVGPNRVFLQYTADLLPNLGIERIRQTTLADLLEALVGRTLPVTTPEEGLARYLQTKATDQERMRQVAQIKGSLRFRRVLDAYAQHLAELGIARMPEKLRASITEETLRERLAGDAIMPVNRRHERMVRRLLKYIEKQTTNLAAHYQNDYAAQIREARQSASLWDPEPPKVRELERRRDGMLASILNRQKALNAQVETAWAPLDAVKAYRQLLADSKLLAAVAADNLSAEEIALVTSGSAPENNTANEPGLTDVDLAPLAYLCRLIAGWNIEKVKRPGHVLIDEAEDLTPFELMLLADFAGHASFTLVGDRGQNVFGYRSPERWDDLVQGVFGARRIMHANLLHSYRSTYEITMLANRVQRKYLPQNAPQAEPVARHGPEPEIRTFANASDWQEAIVGEVRTALATYVSVGVLAKDETRCRSIATMLTKAGLQPGLLLNSRTMFRTGLVVVPVHLARGLEFDAVIVADAQSSIYRNNPTDATLLYVAITRSRHTLTLLAKGKPSTLLA